jgi:tetratricopeptide (TPR) repeat protein
MADIKIQLKNARDERETGDANKALTMFLQIDKDKLESNQLLDYLGELGLTYWHLKRYDEARTTFEETRKLADELKNNSYLAVALRHLSRPEFNEKDKEKSVEYAKEARKLAFEASRQDLAWFDHGIVTALIFAKGSAEEIKKGFEIEAEDLYETSRYSKDDIAKWVWTCGLLIDRAQVFNSPADLYIALMIAEQFNLVRRKEQIEKLIETFNNHE